MSLTQLTANYTDSEGEEIENENDSVSPDESKEAKDSAKGTPASLDSGSLMNTPKKKISGLVSYGNEDDDEEDATFYKENNMTEGDQILSSDAMDTGTDEADEVEAEVERDLGVKLPPAPPGKCSAQLQDKVAHFIKRLKEGNIDWNRKIQAEKSFRNPSIYEKLIDHLSIDEMGSNYPLEMFDAHCWGKQSFYEELSRVQKEEMDRREKERKEKTKVDIISGTKRPAEDDAKKRKSRFDQAVPGVAVAKAVPPPTLTTVPSSHKTAISAFGALKKPK